MKIAYLARRPIPSVHAHSVQIVKMCEALGLGGHDVTLCADRGDADAASIYARYGVDRTFAIDVFPRRVRFLKKLRFALRLRALPFIRNADLFFGRDITSLSIMARSGKPIIYEAHTIPPAGSARSRRLARLFARTNFAHLVCVTSTLAEHHRRQFASLAGKSIIVVPNAAAEPSDAHELAWPGRVGAVQVGFVGRPFPGKGIEMMVAAAAALPDLDFHVVGAAAADLDWIDARIPLNLHLHGYRPHCALGSYLAKFDIAAAPYGAQVMNASGVESAAITSPLKLLEYMAAGLPSIVSGLPGVRDIVDDDLEQVALLVPPGNQAAFNAALVRLAGSPCLRLEMGKSARARYSDRHTLQARAKAVLGQLPCNRV